MRGLIANWLWLLIFLAFAFGFAVGGWSVSRETPTQQHGEGANSAKRGSEETPSPNPQLHASQETRKAEEKEKNPAWSWIVNFFELKLTDIIIAIFTVVLAVKTSGLFVETAGLSPTCAESTLHNRQINELAEKSALHFW
jgi:hypothetical protein